MQGFAQLLDLLIERIFGYSTGFTEAKDSFAQGAIDLKNFVTDFYQNSQHLVDFGNLFIYGSNSAVQFLTICLGLWAIIIVARAAKNCIGG